MCVYVCVWVCVSICKTKDVYMDNTPTSNV